MIKTPRTHQELYPERKPYSLKRFRCTDWELHSSDSLLTPSPTYSLPFRMLDFFLPSPYPYKAAQISTYLHSIHANNSVTKTNWWICNMILKNVCELCKGIDLMSTFILSFYCIEGSVNLTRSIRITHLYSET